MGHDIFAYEPVKVSYLRRSMWSKTIKVLYELLGASDSYASVSGNGDYIYVDVDTLRDAFKEVAKQIKDKDDYEDYSQFLDKCINHCIKTKKDGLLIQFT